jgi:(2Fe-2S) ferredoxin
MALKDIFDRPATPRRLLVCTGPVCDRLGEASALLAELHARLDLARINNDSIAEVSCVRRNCLAKCTGEPLAFVHPDEVWYHDLSVEVMLLVLSEHVQSCRPVVDYVLEDED